MSSEIDIAAGVTKGAISYSVDQIKNFIRRFNNKELAFIEDEDTIELVKQQLRSGEWSLFERYIEHKELRLLVQMGLALRKLSDDKKDNELQQLRRKIYQTFGVKKLRISEFVQNKILTEFIGIIVDKAKTVVDLKKIIEDILFSLEKYVYFIKKDHDPQDVFDEVIIKLKANSPDFFIIFASKSAIPKGKDALFLLMKDFDKRQSEYHIIERTESKKLMIFIVKNEVDYFSE